MNEPQVNMDKRWVNTNLRNTPWLGLGRSHQSPPYYYNPNLGLVTKIKA
jgi:hypothetical protein